MQNSVNNTGKIIAVAVGPITVDEIKDSMFKDGKEAQIRQVFKKSYPSMRTSNEFKDSLFSDEELGIEATDHEENRVTWIPVGKKHKVKDVEAALSSLTGACIYKVLSFSPIISEATKGLLKTGLRGDALASFLEDNNVEGEEWTKECSKILLDKIASRQLVVYGENNDSDKDAEEAVLYNGKKQYREVFFSKVPRADVDLRVEEKQDIPALVLATEEVSETVQA